MLSGEYINDLRLLICINSSQHSRNFEKSLNKSPNILMYWSFDELAKYDMAVENSSNVNLLPPSIFRINEVSCLIFEIY